MTLDSLGNLKRTHYAGALRAAHEGHSVVLMGWVARRRDLGNLIFIDLRDREGIAQIVFNKETNAAAHDKAETLRSEYVVAVEGRVVRRGKPNPEIPTGEVEVVASALHILNTSATPPFVIEDEINASEETRLRYRYLDLRRAKPQANLALRHKVILEIRKAMDELGFYEVETPMLTRATPEGARDYLVPAGLIYPGLYYALPQSPQIFKQILMIGGLDRYFQIARCFRNEDLRADRQPEFTQLDLEMSFVREDEIFRVIERVITHVWNKVLKVKVKRKFKRMSHKAAIRDYGTDKPDLRFGMKLKNVTEFFKAARTALGLEGNVYALVVSGAAEEFSRKLVDELTEHAKSLGAKALYTAKVSSNTAADAPSLTIQSSLERTMGAETLKMIAASIGAKPGDLIVATAAKDAGLLSKGIDKAALIAGQLRLHLGQKLDLIPDGKWEFLWLTGFPLFEWSDKENTWVPAQHPFTGIVEEDLDLLAQPEQRGKIRSKGYDLVLNGVELGSGSVRIHRADVQARIFRAIGLSEEDARLRFGFFLDALSFGTPPHGGIALGLDRVVMLLAGEKSLREVIAFPKTTAAQDLMAKAPSSVDPEQEDELELMGAFPHLPHKCWELAFLADELLRIIDTDLFSKKVPIDSDLRKSLSLLISMAYDDARAAVRLAKAGYGHQAAGLIRSVVEAYINAKYIEKDPEANAKAFLDSLPQAQRPLARKYAPFANDEQTKDAIRSMELVEDKAKWPRSVADRAYAVSKPSLEYDVVYSRLSLLIHPGVGKIAGRLRETPEGDFKIRIGKSPDWVDGALLTVLSYVTQLALICYRAFGVSETGLANITHKFEMYSKASSDQSKGKDL